ncbi:MAG: hypothetical protein AAFN81_18745 [Bacteroidota bacterium]
MTPENLEVIKLVVNTLVSLATISTLFFLLWQTRLLKQQLSLSVRESELANKLAMNQAYQFRYQLYLEMDKLMVEDPALRRLIGTGRFPELFDQGEISLDKARDYAFIELVLNLCQLSFYQYKDGLFDSELGWVKQVVQNDRVIEYWHSGTRCAYRLDFEQKVEKLISEAGKEIEN